MIYPLHHCNGQKHRHNRQERRSDPKNSAAVYSLSMVCISATACARNTMHPDEQNNLTHSDKSTVPNQSTIGIIKQIIHFRHTDGFNKLKRLNSCREQRSNKDGPYKLSKNGTAAGSKNPNGTNKIMLNNRFIHWLVLMEFHAAR